VDRIESIRHLSLRVLKYFESRPGSEAEPASAEAIRRGSMMAEKGVSTQEIMDAELRLGVMFPEEYRTFLTVSNGMVLPFLEGHPFFLKPIREVELFRKVDPESFESWADCEDGRANEFAPLGAMPPDVTKFVEDYPSSGAHFDRAIAISDVVNTGAVLLCSFPMHEKVFHEIWEIGPWTGCVRYRSFFDFVEGNMRSFLQSNE